MPFANTNADKGKSAARAAKEGDGSDERSPLLGQTSLADSPGKAGGVRHGRGLLSEEDEDDEEDDYHTGRAGGRERRRRESIESESSDDLLSPAGRRRRRSNTQRPQYTWRRIIVYIFLSILVLAFITFAVIHIWLGRFVSEQFKNNGQAIRERAPNALVYRGPDKIRILEMSKETTTVQVEMRIGIDVLTVFGWNGTTQAEQKKLSFSRKWERKIVGWAAKSIGQASMDLPEPILVSSKDHPQSPMFQFSLSSPVVIPFYFPKSGLHDPTNFSWLRKITLTVPAEVLDPNLMAGFINQTMATKEGEVHVTLQAAHIALGREQDRSWLTRTVKKYGGQKIENIETDVQFDVPNSTNVPTDPSKLVDLRSYALITIPHNSSMRGNGTHDANETLAVYATAQVNNPGYEQLHNLSLDLAIPFAWPYNIYLPSVLNESELVLLARGVLEPFTIPSASRYFNVSINGTVEQSQNASTPLSQSMSRFISRYLAGDSNRASISYDDSSPFSSSIPSFLVPLLRPIVITYDIPGLPAEERDLLKDLQISNMRIHPAEGGGSGFECDGQIQGELVMPDGAGQLDTPINITSIWPDIFLYDGPAPEGTDEELPPVPLPSNAFARFRTSTWAPATTAKIGNATIMTSMVKNIPLDILRRDVLQRWLLKIVFSGGVGAQTGIKGLTLARASLRGFGVVELKKLPVLGTFYANKPTQRAGSWEYTGSVVVYS